MNLIQSIINFFHRPKTSITIREIKDDGSITVLKKTSAKRSPAKKTTTQRPVADVTIPVKKNQPKERVATRIKHKPDVPKDNTPFIEDYPADTWDHTAFAVEHIDNKKLFFDAELAPALLHAVHDLGFTHCTDIQSEILPYSLKGKDVTGRAQTGTGKTAAFLLTILNTFINKKPQKERKYGAPRALIMAPTRELVIQIEKDARELSKYCGARIMAVFGGMDYEKQRDALEGEYVDIMIATPGRMLDYYKQKVIKLNRVEILVLDEADRMLDMGFLPDMRRIIDAVPDTGSRQTMLFSATLTPEILRLASMWTNEPVKIEIEPDHITNADVEQRAYIVGAEDKFKLLYNILKTNESSRVIIFANRKDEVKLLSAKLDACGFACGMLTGDVTQTKRIKTLESLRNGKINILVATDVAGRGIHVDGVEIVFNYTLPDDPDDYVHRIGRTGRAGAKGLSIAFATEEDAYVLPQIEEHIKEPLKYHTPDENLLQDISEECAANMKNIRSVRRGPRPVGKRPVQRKGKKVR